MCDGCFNTVGDHKHTFVKYDEPNSVPLKCGRPRNYWNEAGTATDGKLFISEWNKCIKDIWITSKEDVARILSEGKASYKPTTRPKAKVVKSLAFYVLTDRSHL